tara:strand:- start:6 stop:701 length:696 start_codon:yes stop_codon:yes gene_type:complete
MKMNKKFISSWKKLIELENHPKNDSDSYKNKFNKDLPDILRNLYNHWPEDVDNISLADNLDTTDLKVKTIKFLVEAEEEDIELLSLEFQNTSLIYEVLKIPEEKRKPFLQQSSRSRYNVSKLIIYANNFFNNLTKTEKEESEYPWVKKISSIDRSIWLDVAEDAENWNVNKKDIEKLKKFSKQNKKKIEDWEWLKDFIKFYISKGAISIENSDSQSENYNTLIIDIWNSIK